MNVFILCTGRTGSVSFVNACRQITNYSAGHETRSGLLGSDRVDFEDNHIEADNRLTWFLGRIDRKYGKDAFYVHLMRDKERVSRSYAKRWGPANIPSAYRNAILIRSAASRLDAARDLVDTMTENISMFLKDKPQQMVIDLENIQSQFPVFWHRIGAEGDLAAAMCAWNVPTNTSQSRRRSPTVTQRLRWGLRAAFPRP